MLMAAIRNPKSYILRNQNFEYFLEIARMHKYEPDYAILRAPSTIEKFSTDVKIKRMYQHALSPLYGGLPVKIAGIHVVILGDVILDEESVSFDNIKLAHDEKILKKFGMRRQMDKKHGGYLRLESLVGKDTKDEYPEYPEYKMSHLQDYRVLYSSINPQLEPQFREVFLEIP